MTIRSGVVITGLPYLRLATTLLQRMRLATSAAGITPASGITPAGGIWEVADIQCRHRPDRGREQARRVPGPGGRHARRRRTGRGRLRPGWPAGLVSCWLEATRWLEAWDQPAVPALVPGYRLRSRADAPDRPHPLAARNGAQVERRLRQCSLYRPELDLMVEAPDGQIAAYGLFWADPVTGVGLVEPMRTEQAHQGRGIASHILASGLDRLAVHG